MGPLERVRSPLTTYIRNALAREDAISTQIDATDSQAAPAQSLVTSVVENRELYVLLARQRQGSTCSSSQRRSQIILYPVGGNVGLTDNAQFVMRLRQPYAQRRDAPSIQSIQRSALHTT